MWLIGIELTPLGAVGALLAIDIGAMAVAPAADGPTSTADIPACALAVAELPAAPTALVYCVDAGAASVAGEPPSIGVCAAEGPEVALAAICASDGISATSGNTQAGANT